MIKLQNLLYPNREICAESALYLHETEKTVSFDGFFNLLYLKKWKFYTGLEELYFCYTGEGLSGLECFAEADVSAREKQGPPSSASLPAADPYRLKTEEYSPRELMQEEQQSSLLESWEHIVRISVRDSDAGILYLRFQKEENEACRELRGAFYVKEALRRREIGIGIDICTYRRESYVERNLKSLIHGLLTGEEAGKRLQIYVVDNGKTLGSYAPVQELFSTLPQLHLCENPNFGGAGGFTRGMLEILKDREKQRLSHVLLMDDDAVIAPESVVRIHGFLSCCREEYRDITVGGAMLREDQPHLLYAMGETWEKNRIQNLLINTDLRDGNEIRKPDFTEPRRDPEHYSGWWHCCYSLKTVRSDNLPLPLFLHHDDIEFGLRNQDRGIEFLNGVGVWHRAPGTLFPGANFYYDVRNGLIEIALHGKSGQKKSSLAFALKSVIGSFLKLRYRELDFAYQGILDFMKGPLWLYRQNPEELNRRLRERSQKLYTEEELCQTLSEREQEELREALALWEKRSRKRDLSHGSKETDPLSGRGTESGELSGTGRLLRLLFAWLPLGSSRIYVLTPGPETPPEELCGKKRILMLEPGSGRMVFGKKQPGKIGELLWRCLKVFILFSLRYSVLKKRWQNGAPEITTEESWKEYLGI